MATELTPQQLVEALYAAFGDNHSRAVHAKGVLLDGSFTPDPRARDMCKANLFAGVPSPVVARFSNFTGIPTIPDTIGEANPRGLALKFKVPGGGRVDVVTHSFDGFPVRTPAEFRELLLALRQSGPNAAKPTPLDKFLATHPIAVTFLTTQKPAPVSYSTLSYFGVNAFELTNEKGESRFVRYRFVPAAGEQLLDPESLATKGPNYLREEIAARVAKSPVEIEWLAQVAEASDVIDDPSVSWPQARKLLKLGTIRLTALVADQEKSDKALDFSPGFLENGIEFADPMLEARHAAYAVSVKRRQS